MLVCVGRKARSLDADLHVISTSLKSVEISEQMVCTQIVIEFSCFYSVISLPFDQ